MTATRVLAHGLARSGLSTLARQFRRLRRRPGRAFVLTYHRISDATGYMVECVPPAAFDMQLGVLRQRSRIVRLHELIERLQNPEPLEEDIAAITFDDGYRDNLDTALPILERHGIPATVFVATGFVDRSVRPTDERLWHAFEVLWRRGPSPHAVCPSANGLRPLVEAALARPGSVAPVRKLRTQLKRLPSAEAERLILEIEQSAGEAGIERSLMLDWNGVRALAQRGVEIASHTVSHAILTGLPAMQVEPELRLSKERIENEIARLVVGFAFPNGSRADFSDPHIALLKRLGYAYACTTVWGVNYPGSDLFRIRRIGVGADSRALLDLKLAIAEGSTSPCAA
jgi:peptidoglycan/xylan/chitin deacetylase (PgdA/CDA1 family)